MGHIAVQLAKWCGAKVFTTVLENEDFALAKAFGASEVINAKEEDVEKYVARLTDNRGFDEELRIEIHEAQNVVERLNSVMGFIFYGKLGEISTNIKEYQELSIVYLHLLQACMAYINTIIFQKVLSRPEWQNVLIPEDKPGIECAISFTHQSLWTVPVGFDKTAGNYS